MNRRVRVAARVALTVAAITIAVGGGTARATTPAQAGASTAVVIVDTGGGTHQTVIHFDGTISGLTALQLAGANPVTIGYGSLGQAVCQLYGAGDPAVPGQCPGGWIYYRAVGGAGGWTPSSLGATNTSVGDGDVEGWKYGGGKPPFSSYCDVVGCAPPPPAAPPATVAPLPSVNPPPAALGDSGGATAPVSASPQTESIAGSTPGSPAPGATSPATADAGTDPSSASTSKTKPVGPTLSGRAAQRRSQTGTATVEVAAGGGPGSDSGSPVGVIVAAAVVAAGVGAGLWLRRRRRPPTPT